MHTPPNPYVRSQLKHRGTYIRVHFDPGVTDVDVPNDSNMWRMIMGLWAVPNFKAQRLHTQRIIVFVGEKPMFEVPVYLLMCGYAHLKTADATHSVLMNTISVARQQLLMLRRVGVNRDALDVEIAMETTQEVA